MNGDKNEITKYCVRLLVPRILVGSHQEPYFRFRGEESSVRVNYFLGQIAVANLPLRLSTEQSRGKRRNLSEEKSDEDGSEGLHGIGK